MTLKYIEDRPDFVIRRILHSNRPTPWYDQVNWGYSYVRKVDYRIVESRIVENRLTYLGIS